ncbi:hypothetical protein FJY93_00310 [Candidatus Kaiserbacteria bacterium]|nr:hypothetical protein [Candidatus Kaiserbacteria bacterium]
MLSAVHSPQIRKSIVAGILFICVCILFLSLTSILTLSEHLLPLFLILTFSTMVFARHLYGYVVVAESYGGKRFSISVALLIGASVMFGIGIGLVGLSIVFGGDGFTSFEGRTGNMLANLAILLGVIPAILFAYELIRMRSMFGFLTFGAAAMPFLAGIFFFNPWPSAIAVTLSSLLLYRIDTGKYPFQTK